MKKFFALWLVALMIIVYAQNGYSKDRDDDGHVAAIQDRIFHRYHEINLGLGYIPDDDFYYLFPGSIGYTYSFNEHWAWEVARVQWMISMEKDLKEDLERDFGVTPTRFSEPKYAVHSNFIYKFLYGKSVFGDKTIINHETYGLLGGGMIAYEDKINYGGTESELAPSLSFGIGQKIFLSENVCVNVELRDWVNFKEDETINNIYFGVSIGFRFNLSPRKGQKDSMVEKIIKYLE